MCCCTLDPHDFFPRARARQQASKQSARPQSADDEQDVRLIRSREHAKQQQGERPPPSPSARADERHHALPLLLVAAGCEWGARVSRVLPPRGAKGGESATTHLLCCGSRPAPTSAEDFLLLLVLVLVVVLVVLALLGRRHVEHRRLRHVLHFDVAVVVVGRRAGLALADARLRPRPGLLGRLGLGSLAVVVAVLLRRRLRQVALLVAVLGVRRAGLLLGPPVGSAAGQGPSATRHVLGKERGRHALGRRPALALGGGRLLLLLLLGRGRCLQGARDAREGQSR